MKTKIFRYSRSLLNKVVTCYVELTKLDESVYIYLIGKDDSDKEYDTIGIVLKVDDVYFELYDISRNYIKRPDFLLSAKQKAENYISEIKKALHTNGYVSLLEIKVWEALGHDPAPLIRHREDRKSRLERENLEKERLKEIKRKQQEAEEKIREDNRLEQEKQKLLKGELIQMEDFLSLCKKDGLKINIRTLGTLKKSVLQVAFEHLRYNKIPGKRKPNFDGCYKVIEEYLQLIKNK